MLSYWLWGIFSFHYVYLAFTTESAWIIDIVYNIHIFIFRIYSFCSETTLIIVKQYYTTVVIKTTLCPFMKFVYKKYQIFIFLIIFYLLHFLLSQVQFSNSTHLAASSGVILTFTITLYDSLKSIKWTRCTGN